MEKKNWKTEFQKLKRKYDCVKTERDTFYTIIWMLVMLAVGIVFSQFYTKFSELSTGEQITLASFTLAAIVFVFKIGSFIIKKVEED